jgi:hypothetical protein
MLLRKCKTYPLETSTFKVVMRGYGRNTESTRFWTATVCWCWTTGDWSKVAPLRSSLPALEEHSPVSSLQRPHHAQQPPDCLTILPDNSV